MFQPKFNWEIIHKEKVILFWNFVQNHYKIAKIFNFLIHNFCWVDSVSGRYILSDFHFIDIWMNKKIESLSKVTQDLNIIICWDFNTREFKVEFEERLINKSLKIKRETCKQQETIDNLMSLLSTINNKSHVWLLGIDLLFFLQSSSWILSYWCLNKL